MASVAVVWGFQEVTDRQQVTGPLDKRQQGLLRRKDSEGESQALISSPSPPQHFVFTLAILKRLCSCHWTPEGSYPHH